MCVPTQKSPLAARTARTTKYVHELHKVSQGSVTIRVDEGYYMGSIRVA